MRRLLGGLAVADAAGGGFGRSTALYRRAGGSCAAELAAAVL
jgi:hypothetical protein